MKTLYYCEDMVNFIAERIFRAGPRTSLEVDICPLNSDKQHKNKVFGRSGRDCLNTIRLLAALQVVYGHSLTHLHIESIPVLNECINFFYGVPIFFTMSGFLIWQSVGRSRGFREYLGKRFWRIFPELWAAVAIELIVLLCLYHDSISWPQFVAFAITQGTIFQFWTPDCLRGYGCGTPNGALWTICVLIQFYFFVYFLYKVLHGRKTYIWMLWIITSLCVSVLLPIITRSFPEIACKLLNQTIIPYFWMFIFASFVAEKKDVVLPFLMKYCWAFFVGVIVVRYLNFDVHASYNVLGTTMLFFFLIGMAYTFPKINVTTDISYGIYIYIMTIVNAFIVFGYTGNQLLLLPVALITCVLAWLSTKTIGNLCKKKKKKIV